MTTAPFPASPSPSSGGLRLVRELEAHLTHLHEVSRLLPALTADNSPAERKRLIASLTRGEVPNAKLRSTPRKVTASTWSTLQRARALASELPIASLYLPRLEEIELDLLLLESLGDAKRVRSLCKRRFGTGEVLVPSGQTLRSVADRILEEVHGTSETPIIAAEALEGPSIKSLMLAAADAAGLELEVKIEPRLAAGAATGDRIVYLQGRDVGSREAVRLTVHEVYGHLTAAANGRAQPLRIVEYGTASSFRDQEGIALYLEHKFGVLDAHRLRTLAARVVVSDRLHAGASFGDTARMLYYDFGFTAPSSIALCERAWRGGGVARDVGYLHGFLRVAHASESGVVTIDEMRAGRVSVEAAQALRELKTATGALYRDPIFRPKMSSPLFDDYLRPTGGSEQVSAAIAALL